MANDHSAASSAKLYGSILADLGGSRKKYKTLDLKKGIRKQPSKRSLLADVKKLKNNKLVQSSQKMYLMARW